MGGETEQKPGGHLGTIVVVWVTEDTGFDPDGGHEEWSDSRQFCMQS